MIGCGWLYSRWICLPPQLTQPFVAADVSQRCTAAPWKGIESRRSRIERWSIYDARERLQAAKYLNRRNIVTTLPRPQVFLSPRPSRFSSSSPIETRSASIWAPSMNFPNLETWRSYGSQYSLTLVWTLQACCDLKYFESSKLDSGMEIRNSCLEGKIWKFLELFPASDFAAD